MTHAHSHASRLGLTSLALVLTLPLVLAIQGARAQGTSGLLPNPISSRDLDLYGVRLDLTPEQRKAIEPFHDDYLEGFRNLREREIKQYMQDVTSLWRGGLRSLDREVIEESLRKQQRLMSKIGLLDAQLIDDVQSLLREDQIAGLPAVKQARDRERFRTGGAQMVRFVNRASRVDIGRLYGGLELNDEERAATKPLVIQYESRLTRATKALYEAASRVFLDVAETLEEQGFSADNPGADRRQMMEAMRNAWTEAIEKPRQKAEDISDLNRKSLRQISEFLTEQSAATWRDRYFRRAYPEVPRSSASTALRGFRLVLNNKTALDSLKSQVTAMATEFRGRRDAVVDQMITYIDESRRGSIPFGRNRGNRQERETRELKLTEFRERLTELDEAALRNLYGMLDADLTQDIELAVAAAAEEFEKQSRAQENERRGGGGADEARGVFAGAAGPDPFLPNPITRREITEYVDRLRLGDDDRFILESLHEEYMTGFNRVRETDFAALRSAKAKLPRSDPDEEDESPASATPEQIDEVYDLRHRAFKSIQNLDEALFDDIETLIATPEQAPKVQRLRLARQRTVYNRGLSADTTDVLFGGGRRGRGQRSRWSMAEFESHEADVDLAGVVDKLDLNREQRTAMDKLLVDYEANATEGFRKQYDSVVNLRHQAEKIRAQQAQAREESGDNEESRRGRWSRRWEVYRELRENQGTKAREARKTIVDLNRATIVVLSEALPSDLAALLQEGYNRAAFPTVYQNPESADRYLATALELRDLSEGQANRIYTIIEEHAPPNRHVQDQIAEVFAAWEDVSSDGDRGAWRNAGDYRNKLEVLKFEQQEVGARALRQLREVLSDQQQTRLRLPDEAVNEGDEDE